MIPRYLVGKKFTNGMELVWVTIYYIYHKFHLLAMYYFIKDSFKEIVHVPTPEYLRRPIIIIFSGIFEVVKFYKPLNKLFKPQ